MTSAEYLQTLDNRRQTLSGMPRTWADYNMALEIINARPTPDIIKMAVSGCRKIIVDP